MGNLFTLYIALAVFGIGVTIVDFLGIMDQAGDSGDSGGDSSDSGASAAKAHGSYLGPGAKAPAEKHGIRALTALIGLLRSAVYFSLGFGPTGIFATLIGLSPTASLVWASGIGAGVMVLARLLKRFIRRDLDSSIKPDELLHEKGVLLLPLEGESISKAVVKQFGRETRVYVRCSQAGVKLSKGQEVIIVDHDDDVYWVKPLEPS